MQGRLPIEWTCRSGVSVAGVDTVDRPFGLPLGCCSGLRQTDLSKEAQKGKETRGEKLQTT
jgi:hypothetical protein